MTKVDILIKGSLLCKQSLQMGGGKLAACRQMPADYDVSDAVTLEGDVSLTSFDAKGKTVLVIGHVTTLEEGGNHGEL